MKHAFKWLNISQFTGAFNDNAFKMTAAIVLVKILGEDSVPAVLAICSALFVIPFLLFSNVAGGLADRFSKRDIIIASKWMEVGLLAIGIPILLTGLAWPVYTLLFLLCTQSALFGPAKRGIIPELVDDSDLSKANGYLTAATYISIILGTALPSLIIGYMGLSPLFVIGTCSVLSFLGTLAAYRIDRVAPVGSVKTSSVWILPDVSRALKNLRSDTWALQAVLGLVLFGGITALLQQTLVIYGREVLSLTIEKSPMLFPLAAIGIGVGALLTGYFSKHTIEIGLIPVGALGVMGSSVALSFVSHPVWIGVWIVHLGACCGMYLVPLNAFLQYRIPASRRGEAFGASSFLSFSAMVIASAFFYLITNVFHCDARSCVFITGLVAAVPAVIACKRLPNFFTRFWLMRLIHRLYKIRFSGIENLPREGGALLICNHTAYADPLLLQAATQRPVRFLMSRDVYKSWKWANPIFKLTDCIPIHTSDGPRALVQSLKEAREAMEAGAIIAIFPEGELTKNGNLMKFNKGFERIIKDSNCPIIPAHIGNLWGSIFSFFHGKPGIRCPRKFPYPVSVRFGTPLPSDTSADEARRVISELAADYATEQSLVPKQTLSHQFLKRARRNWFRLIASDTTGMKSTYGKLLVSSIALANRIKPAIGKEENIGILMPTSIGGVVANLALTLSGKTVVNLNWTASADAMEAAIKQADIKHVLTSRRFAGKTSLPELPVSWVYLEDTVKDITVADRFQAVLAAVFASSKHLAGGREPQPLDIAAIIFSSGSTGTPKGVMLSHANLCANVESVQQVQQFSKYSRVCALLPLFHAFGYLGLLWWPLLKGIRIFYHANPLQTDRIIRLVRDEKLSIMLATPTFLQGYMRKASAIDFKTLKTVITGGEKLRPELAVAFNKQFGIKPQEGYGCTELSPVAMLSLKSSNRTGSTGQPVPGVAVRIVNPQTFEILPNGDEGLMLIKGPNVMQGYLAQPEKTTEVLTDGWYNTGDIARMDEQGFIYITGRISRFSKIGGEMVPHGAVEDALQLVSGSEQACVAVVSISSKTKGEQLAVCYTAQAGDPETLVSKLRSLDLPNLWIPRAANFFHIKELPILGTGKLDFCTLNEWVRAS